MTVLSLCSILWLHSLKKLNAYSSNCFYRTLLKPCISVILKKVDFTTSSKYTLALSPIENLF